MQVYVFGLGHIGLPMATWIALHQHQVNGIDVNPNHIEKIRNSSINIEEYYNGQHISLLAQNLIEKQSFEVSTEFKRINNEPSVFVIAVGIANNEDGSHNISPLVSVIDTIIPSLLANDLLLFRTTLIPGTLDRLVVPRIKTLKVPVLLAYCPETLMETHAFEELENNPMILAGMDEESFKAAGRFLHSLSNALIYKASTIKIAEMIKVIQNIQRDVNIALVNEISEVTYQLNLNIDELISLVNTHPRVKLLQPGPGVGGYCLPEALGYLQEAVDLERCPLTLIRTARELNVKRPRKIVETVRSALHDAGKVLGSSTIALVGLAMKDFCADCRDSPALRIASLLVAEGAKVQAFDPLVPMTYSFQVASFQECLKNADCLVIAAYQKGITFELEQIQATMSQPLLVIDTRNVFPDFAEIKVYKP